MNYKNPLEQQDIKNILVIFVDISLTIRKSKVIILKNAVMSIYLSFDLIDELPENAVYTGEGKSWVLEGHVQLKDGTDIPICRRIDYSKWYLPDEDKEVAFQRYVISRRTEADIRKFYKDEL